MPRILLRSVLLALLVSGCSSMQFTADYDPGLMHRFPTYATYAWLDPPGHFMDDNRPTANDLVAGRIQQAIDEALTKRGYERVEPGQADFNVAYHFSFEGRMDVHRASSYYGYGWGHWYGPAGGVVYSDSYVREYTQGTLIIDVVDTGGNMLAWRGSASAEIKPGADPGQSQKRLNDVATRILKPFPPGLE